MSRWRVRVWVTVALFRTAGWSAYAPMRSVIPSSSISSSSISRSMLKIIMKNGNFNAKKLYSRVERKTWRFPDDFQFWRKKSALHRAVFQFALLLFSAHPIHSSSSASSLFVLNIRDSSTLFSSKIPFNLELFFSARAVDWARAASGAPLSRIWFFLTILELLGILSRW